MTIEWIRQIRCAWRARRLLSNIALLTDAYCGLANRLDNGFNEDTFTDAYHMRHVIDTRLGELGSIPYCRNLAGQVACRPAWTGVGRARRSR